MGHDDRKQSLGVDRTSGASGQCDGTGLVKALRIRGEGKQFRSKATITIR